MKMRTKLYGAVATTAVTLAAHAGLAQDVKLAFIITNPQNPAEVSMATGFEQKAKELGAAAQIFSADGSVEKMSNDIDDAVALGFNGIATITMDSVVAQTWVDRANEAKVPYVSVAVQVGDPEKVPFREVYPGLSALVGQDYILSGRRLGEAAAAQLPKDRPVKIGIVEGQPGYALVGQLNQGFKEALDAAGLNYEIVFSQPTDWTPANGQEVCQNGLVATPDIDLIFSHAEDMAIGCAGALEGAGSQALLVTAAGGSKLGTPLIKSGDIDLSMCEAVDPHRRTWSPGALRGGEQPGNADRAPG